VIHLCTFSFIHLTILCWSQPTDYTLASSRQRGNMFSYPKFSSYFSRLPHMHYLLLKDNLKVMLHPHSCFQTKALFHISGHIHIWGHKIIKYNEIYILIKHSAAWCMVYSYFILFAEGGGMTVHIYTGCFTILGHNCRRWFPRSLWSKKFI
jgi:hypothetical protein